jgi:co-chaperonin GroES (HSP10)
MENKPKIQALGRSVIVKEVVNEVKVGDYDFSNKEDKNDKFRKGVIVSICPDVPKDENGESYVKEGDTVMYDSYKTTNITIDGEVYSTFYLGDLVVRL